jgi:hypothetical protein
MAARPADQIREFDLRQLAERELIGPIIELLFP